MKLLAAFPLLFVCFTTFASAVSFNIAHKTYSIAAQADGGALGTAYGYRGKGVIPAAPTLDQLEAHIKSAAMEMIAIWKDMNEGLGANAKKRNQLPTVMALFWPADATNTAWIHSSVRGTGTIAAANIVAQPINAVLQAALDACKTDFEDGHGNGANCGEVMVLHMYSQANPAVALNAMPNAVMIAVRIDAALAASTDPVISASSVRLFNPCDGAGKKAGHAFGCEQLMRQLNLRWCTEERVIGVKARVRRALARRAPAAAKHAMVAMKRATCPAGTRGTLRPPVGAAAAACPVGLRMRAITGRDEVTGAMLTKRTCGKTKAAAAKKKAGAVKKQKVVAPVAAKKAAKKAAPVVARA